MIRSFRARISLYTLDKQPAATADCLLSVEMQPFTRSRWFGTLKNLDPASPRAGRYLMRFPNGRVREVELGSDELLGCPFTGVGELPLP